MLARQYWIRHGFKNPLFLLLFIHVFPSVLPEEDQHAQGKSHLVLSSGFQLVIDKTRSQQMT